jgi:hypothetical protein
VGLTDAYYSACVHVLAIFHNPAGAAECVAVLVCLPAWRSSSSRWQTASRVLECMQHC